MVGGIFGFTGRKDRGEGVQNRGLFGDVGRGIGRGLYDIAGYRDKKLRKSSFSNLAKVNPNTVASIAAKVDALIIHLGIPYLYTDGSCSNEYLLSRFNPATQSNEGRGFVRIAPNVKKQIQEWANRISDCNNCIQLIQKTEAKLLELKKNITALSNNMSTSSQSDSGVGSLFNLVSGSTNIASGGLTCDETKLITDKITTYSLYAYKLNCLIDKYEMFIKTSTYLESELPDKGETKQTQLMQNENLLDSNFVGTAVPGRVIPQGTIVPGRVVSQLPIVSPMQEQSSSNLPPFWEEKIDLSSGRKYYINHTNQTTQWDFPTA
jgi:hypothetical protein